MNLQQLFLIFMVGVGVFFLLVGSIGIIRLPDFFTRTHATSMSDTLGMMLVLGGLAVHEGFTIAGAKLIIAVIFVAVTVPVASHAVAKAALQSGLKPRLLGDSGGETDQQGEEN